MDSLNDFLNALQQPEDASAPFNLTESTNNKVIFEKVRAKNFRSIGNEFMEFNFIAHKTTLVVSEDNGSGKSTLCVWAPYFALTGRPYGKSEKIGALVNSQTRKNMIVEFYLRTKGFRYKIVRGYKPSVFDIYREESGSWVKFEAPASNAQYQADLERLVGFDSKVLEKMTILGLDKFSPFIDLDASNRRLLVEKIWDLSVFSVMMEEAKKRASILKRQKEQTSVDIDTQEAKLVSEKEKMEQAEGFKEDVEVLRKELINLTHNRIPELNERIIKVEHEYKLLVSETTEILETKREEKGKITAEVSAKFKEDGRVLKEKLDTANKLGAELKEKAAEKFLATKAEIENEITAKREENKAQNEAFIKEVEEGVEELEKKLEEAREESKVLAEQKVAEKKGQEPFLKMVDEYEAKKAELEALKQDASPLVETINVLDAKVVVLQNDIKAAEQRASGHETNVRLHQAELDKFEESKKKLEETGDCPHCLQHIGEEALKLYEESISGKVSSIKSAIEEISRDIRNEKDFITSGEVELENIKSRIADINAQKVKIDAHIKDQELKLSALDTSIQIEKTRWENEMELLRAQVIDSHTEEAENKLSEYRSAKREEGSQIGMEQERVMNALKLKLDTLQASINEAVSKAETEAEKLSSEAKVAYETWQDRARSALAEATAEINQTIKACEVNLAAEEIRYEDTKASIGKSITETNREIDSKKESIKTFEERIERIVAGSTTAIEEVEAKLEELRESHQKYTDDLSLNAYMIDELGDSAAKREIIKKYIPFLNNKINEYMSAMNLFVGFKMDEKFDITFEAPDRKSQTIYSLSNGQKTRMNLAVLFALRDVANLKNTTDCNLLVLDELLESLSEQGVREVAEMLRIKFSNSNVIVITQRRSEFCEYFGNDICYGLRGGFTVEVDS